MNNKFKKILSIVMALSIIAASFVFAFADETTSSDSSSSEGSNSVVDFAENVFAVGDGIGVAKGNFFGGFGVGKEIVIENTFFDDVLMLAAQNIEISDTQVGSSAFMGASSISLNSFYTSGNYFAAAMSVSATSSVNTKTFYVAAKDVTYMGFTDTARIFGDDINFGGTVFGDATIYADTVKILDSTVVYGTLNITAKEEPEIPAGAQIGEYNFTKMEDSDVESVQKVIEVKKDSTIKARLKSAVSLSVSMAIAALILCWLKPYFVENSIIMLKTHPVKILVTGLITFIAVPLVVIVLFTTIVGIPVAAVILLLFIAIIWFSLVFAGSALGRMFIGKLGKYVSSVIGVVVCCFVYKIPYLGQVFGLVATFYSLGVIVQLLWQTRLVREPKAPKEPKEKKQKKNKSKED